MNKDQEIIAGFNAGYLLAQKNPKLAEQLRLAVAEVDDPYFQAFVQGCNEFDKEPKAVKRNYPVSRTPPPKKDKKLEKDGPDKG